MLYCIQTENGYETVLSDENFEWNGRKNLWTAIFAVERRWKSFSASVIRSAKMFRRWWEKRIEQSYLLLLLFFLYLVFERKIYFFFICHIHLFVQNHNFIINMTQVVWIFDESDPGGLPSDRDEELHQRGRRQQLCGQMDQVLLYVHWLESKTNNEQRCNSRLRHGYDEQKPTAHSDDSELP